jgi:hypothetical protein
MSDYMNFEIGVLTIVIGIAVAIVVIRYFVDRS